MQPKKSFKTQCVNVSSLLNAMRVTILSPCKNEALMLLPYYQNGLQELPGQSIEANNFINPIKIRSEQNSSFKIFPNNQKAKTKTKTKTKAK